MSHGYKMYASGFGRETYPFNTKEEAKRAMQADAKSTASQYAGTVQDFGDEITVYASDGTDIATFTCF